MKSFLLTIYAVLLMPASVLACETCKLTKPAPGQRVVEYDLRIAEGRQSPAGKPVRVLTINGGIPGPTLRFREGDFARIRVHNDLPNETTSTHWHGLLVPNNQDGVPHVTTPPILPGTTHTFGFTLRQSGTYWYHSHTHLQEQSGVYGSIVVEPRGGERVEADREQVLLFSDWTDTDPHRTGMLPFVFDDGFGYERYADYMLDVPMYFVFRDGGYVDAAGLDFKDFLTGNLSVRPGEKPTKDDWNDHLSTAFPEVRLKSFLEMRGADGGPWNTICALPAFWVGILYDQTALDAAWDLVKHWSIEEQQQLRDDVPRLALDARAPGGKSLHEIAREVMKIADAGLKSRARLNGAGDSEQSFLNPLHDIVASGKVPAQRLLDRYHGEWNGDLSRIYGEMSF